MTMALTLKLDFGFDPQIDFFQTHCTSSFRNPFQKMSPRSKRPSTTRPRRNVGGEMMRDNVRLLQTATCSSVEVRE
ncbi:hypothetical protein Patl1_05292 [Pistacia atlantica]|uniref:Uncharacterized protein n=1 Tax=Pistacia atlantica TaxID=434234 RepID=A0ACC1BU30_9ROSI|nr:hypothetical protein Patl1_05292 [Pistacia atlantica]